MYPQFFGFTKLPFRLRPDSEFLFSGQSYVQTRASVLSALRGGSSLVLLLGPPGVGKTLLLEDVMGEVAGQFATCRINQPHISATELIHALLLQLGAPSSDANAGRPRLFKELVAALESPDTRQAMPLLVIDDAQLLGPATLQAVKDILARVHRLKVLLIGRDEPQARGETLTTRLTAVPKLRQVNLLPLSAEGTKYYIDHRLGIVGGGDKEVFTTDAYSLIFQHSGGSARLINLLCDAALHTACLRASVHVGAAEILVATQDARWSEALARDKAGSSPPPTAPADAFSDQDAEAESMAADESPPSEEPAAQIRVASLVVTHRKEHITTWPIADGRISIGRATDNELRLDAPYISRHHCQVVTVGNVSTIEDLGSVNGFWVNGKLAKRHVLQHADQIALGQHVLTYVVTP